MKETLHYETTKQAAARLGVSRRQIQKWCAEEKIKCIKMGRDYLIESGAEPVLSRARREQGTSEKVKASTGNAMKRQEALLDCTACGHENAMSERRGDEHFWVRKCRYCGYERSGGAEPSLSRKRRGQ